MSYIGIRPTFFGANDRQLFGVHHAGRGDRIRDVGVLLCYPAPQESSMVQWAYNRLSGLLAASGFSVLRFDYFGTGDSAGTSDDGTLTSWVGDIQTAATELRDATGVRRISVVGMRMGAALAMRAVAEGLPARDLVLWDPVVNGQRYLAQLDGAERWVLQREPYPVPEQQVPGTLMGFPFSANLRQETAAVDLSTDPFGAPRRLMVVAPRRDASHQQFVERASDTGIATQYVVVDDPLLYWENTYPGETLIAHGAPKAITAFLAEGRA